MLRFDVAILDQFSPDQLLANSLLALLETPPDNPGQELPQSLATERLTLFRMRVEDLRRTLHVSRHVDDVQDIHRVDLVGKADFGDLTQAHLTV